MNILFISHTGGKSGGETVLIDIIKIISLNTNHKIFLVIPNDGYNNFIEGIESLHSHITIKRLKFRGVGNTTFLFIRNFVYSILFGLPQMKQFIIKNNIDLVYVNSSINIIGIIVARRTKRPYIWHFHEQPTPLHRWTPKWFNKFYLKWLLDKRCKSIFVNHTSYKIWLNELGINEIKNSVVLYSPYQEYVPIKKESTQFTFGYIGHISPNKNISSLIIAFNQLQCNFKLLIAGNGKYEKELWKQAKNNTNIQFLGRIENPQTFYSQIDALVVVSLNESWGLVVLEAMSAEIPVIMTKNTGLVELFTNNKECIFVDPLSITEITDKLTKIACNESLRNSIVKNATNKLFSENLNILFKHKIINILNESTT